MRGEQLRIGALLAGIPPEILHNRTLWRRRARLAQIFWHRCQKGADLRMSHAQAGDNRQD
ncbi:transcriptional regulator/sugar kinase [Mycolicibacterium canariasense]|uniref:Transcriptional regulator/sugar kinase n=1 Tax=Mycolicibacterium canariasense TaxID=228230 RepID=A0A100WE56_MYCCR|nr:transcriptional regulator/sugar kinase [Mycolicibacterium canariasense]